MTDVTGFVSLRLELGLQRRVEAFAVRRGWSRSQAVRWLLEQALDNPVVSQRETSDHSVTPVSAIGRSVAEVPVELSLEGKIEQLRVALSKPLSGGRMRGSVPSPVPIDEFDSA